MLLIFKIKDDNGFYKNKSLHFAIGINLEGKKELLGMWILNNEGAKFWLSIVTELKKHYLKIQRYITFSRDIYYPTSLSLKKDEKRGYF